MAAKLYLIRVNVENYLGPLTADQVLAAYQNMEFGLQDEISGSLSEWISFDDIAGIEKYYPELVFIVKQEMLAGWGEIQSNNYMDQYQGPNSAGRSVWRRVRYLLLILIMAGGGWLFARKEETLKRWITPAEPNPARALNLYESKNQVPFEAYMDRYSREIVKRVKASKKQYKQWIPYIRVLAYRRSGKFPGLRPRYLRGVESIPAPNDCSLDSWSKRWSKSKNKWKKFLSGKSFIEAEWSRILLWDPNWIRRRRVSIGWLEPPNYYVGCLKMAALALDKLELGADLGSVRNDLQARLKWQLNLAQGNDLLRDATLTERLWVLSCLESSSDWASVQECEVEDVQNPKWVEVIRWRRVWSQMFSLIATDNVLDPEKTEELKALLKKTDTVDSYTGFEYHVEADFLQQVVLENGNIANAIHLFSKGSLPFSP